MVGMVGSGKTTYVCAKFTGHVHVSLDTNKRRLRYHRWQMLAAKDKTYDLGQDDRPRIPAVHTGPVQHSISD